MDGLVGEEATVGIPSWSPTAVYALLGVTLVTYVLGIGFIVEEGIFAPLSDAGAFAVAVLLVPVVVALHRMDRDARGSGLVLTVGLVAAVATAVASVGLILANTLVEGLSGPPFLAAQFVGTALQGVWLVGTGWLGVAHGTRTRRTGFAGGVAGVGYLLGIGGLAAGFGFAHPTVGVGFLVGAVGFVVWALSLGAELRAIVRGPVPAWSG